MIPILSLGAGVQSTALALMAAHGEVSPMPDRAIFADTGSEPAAVYTHLEWLTAHLPYPVDIVGGDGPSLGAVILAATRGDDTRRSSQARPPFFVRNADGDKGIIRRQCTSEYKIEPIHRHIRALLGLSRGQRWPKEAQVEQWMGISIDEASRMRESRIPAIRLRYPLIERGATRASCLDWLEARGYPLPPKSACTFCPYRSDTAWRQLKDSDPQGWADALEMDAAIRTGLQQPSLKGELFLHSSLRPLAEVDLSTAKERGQPNLFENECEGLCGV